MRARACVSAPCAVSARRCATSGHLVCCLHFEKKPTGNGKQFASPETCAEVRRSKKMHLLHQAWVSLLLLLLLSEQLLGRCNGR